MQFPERPSNSLQRDVHAQGVPYEIEFMLVGVNHKRFSQISGT